MSTRIDFYVLNDSDPQARDQTACRIIEKAWQQQLRVYTHAASSQAAAQFDTLLWTFKQNSFIPHEVFGGTSDALVPIWIGFTSPPVDTMDVLVNLNEEVPGFFAQFDRVVELIAVGDSERRSGRQRWRVYKEHGCEIQSHNV